ncbi:MAG: cytochrome P450 [Chloroflexota bacterium]|nr:cytochrome P450 [Chloroflexota bacterium]
MQPLDLFSPAMRSDPYPIYADLRRNQPLARVTHPLAGQMWMLSRYDDVLAALKDPRLSTEGGKVGKGIKVMESWWIPKTFKRVQRNMLSLDDPDHCRIRDLVHQAFTPRMLEGLTARIQHITDALLDTMARQPAPDLVRDFALPLPVTVIADMMGVPQHRRSNFHRWSAAMLDAGSGGALGALLKLPDILRLMGFLEQLAQLRRDEPADDLTTALVRARQGDDRLSEDELISMLFLLLVAGHETTVGLLGGGMQALFEHPDQLTLLKTQPELIDSAIEELLRYTTPVMTGAGRYVLEDMTLHGQQLPRGSLIALNMASANRDESVFADGDRLDIRRSPNRHLGFGMGIHYCLGAPLARLEAKIGLPALLTRFPNIRPANPSAPLDWRPSIAARGLRSLPVVLD